MSLWRLEWLRLVRTRRLVGLVAVYLFFGATEPVLLRYAGEIMGWIGGDITVVLPPTRPADVFGGYTGNANQIGLLVFVLVAAGATAVDAQREMAVFLRTRVRAPRRLLLPKVLVPAAAGAAAFTVGVAVTWWGTAWLVGPADAGGVLAGTACGAAYLAFVAALTAAFGARLPSAVATAAATLASAAALGVLGSVAGARGVGAWLPSRLAGALADLAGGGDAASYVPALLSAAVVGAGLVMLGARVSAGREL